MSRYERMMLCFTLQRYKIESNSQLLHIYLDIHSSCVLHCKDTKLKAIHNRTGEHSLTIKLCFTLQRYKIESNSQLLSLFFFDEPLCFTLQRYKIESNSQLNGTLEFHVMSCVLHCKDTKLKAIHNLKARLNFT